MTYVPKARQSAKAVERIISKMVALDGGNDYLTVL